MSSVMSHTEIRPIDSAGMLPMKVLIIQAPYRADFSEVRDLVSQEFPLGPGYVVSYLLHHGVDAELIDPENARLDLEALSAKILSDKPAIIGLSAMTSNFPVAARLATMVRSISDALIVIGGVHATSLPREVLAECSAIDLVVVGEGEETMLEVCRARQGESRPDWSRIHGLAWRAGDKILLSPPRPVITDVDTIPMPARQFTNLALYEPPRYLEGRRHAVMRTSRGCPCHCTFCAAHGTMGFAFRPHSPDYVIREIRHLVEEHGIETILLYDDTFTMDRKRVLEICDRIIAARLAIELFCLARVNTVDEELMARMREAGFTAISFGIESGNAEVLKKIRKGTTLDQARCAVALARRAGFRIFSSFMFGLPGDTRSSMEETIRFSLELDPDCAFFFILTPLPGSAIFRDHGAELITAGARWSDFKYVIGGGELVLRSDRFTEADLRGILAEANRRFYGRPSYMIRQFLRVRSPRELLARIRGGITLARQVLMLRR